MLELNNQFYFTYIINFTSLHAQTGTPWMVTSWAANFDLDHALHCIFSGLGLAPSLLIEYWTEAHNQQIVNSLSHLVSLDTLTQTKGRKGDSSMFARDKWRSMLVTILESVTPYATRM